VASIAASAARSNAAGSTTSSSTSTITFTLRIAHSLTLPSPSTWPHVHARRADIGCPGRGRVVATPPAPLACGDGDPSGPGGGPLRGAQDRSTRAGYSTAPASTTARAEACFELVSKRPSAGSAVSWLRAGGRSRRGPSEISRIPGAPAVRFPPELGSGYTNAGQRPG
jgi:hypothetical protein